VSESASPLPASVDAAREALSHARRLLCEPSPANLQLCCALFAKAHKAIEAIHAVAAKQKRSADRGLASALAGLHSEINVIGILLERAAAFHANLLKDMIAASSAPVPDAAPPQSTRLLVEA
jgi:hypothetical protein